MSLLSQRIVKDMQDAMKAKEARRVSVLRMIFSSMKNAKIASGKELSDEAVVTIIQKEIKQKQETLEQCQLAEREELCKKEKEEISYLEEYLPKQLSDEEVSDLIEQKINKLGAESIQDMGKVMGAVMPKIQGRYDGSKVQLLVRERLS